MSLVDEIDRGVVSIIDMLVRTWCRRLLSTWLEGIMLGYCSTTLAWIVDRSLTWRRLTLIFFLISATETVDRAEYSTRRRLLIGAPVIVA